MKMINRYIVSLLFPVGLLIGGPIDNKIENKKSVDNIAKGFDYYEGTVNKQIEAKKSNEEKILEYLKIIKEENQKQTKIQNKIYDLLKRKFDPEPKVITKKDGTKCVANSTDDCFDYASLIENHPEVNKIPALKEFLKDPYDLSKTANYLKWQTALFNHAFNTGNAIQFAQEQFGNESGVMSLNRSSFDDSKGVANAKLLPEIKKKYLYSIKDKFEINIFIGLNINLDIVSVSGIADLLITLPELNYKFYYKDKASKALFEDTMNLIYADNLKRWNIVQKQISSEKFNELNVLTSPSFVILYKKDDDTKTIKAQTIHTGRINTSLFYDKVFNYLEYINEIDYKKLSDTDFWDTKKGEDEAKEEIKRKFGVSVDELINKYSNGGNE
ncbi:hypothetical protein CP985_03395 [Malaciobacter mytili LMG 24559]|uniref:Uncharacterized protein n=1 Tax=Malaciobacter mytili LMG 24559 TaxID=1032238 RepID=A0AAX2AIA9_9BACT|nr:hypothetical protein [Malaciobacter mytili]AXH16402.1 hypothetical protein AMYT_a0104 [Malaciobacter mytili LMG 24559]RXK16469.1 hypothetical protein CP985_03395 [Malaciobacter mytili LMG 24559]